MVTLTDHLVIRILPTNHVDITLPAVHEAWGFHECDFSNQLLLRGCEFVLVNTTLLLDCVEVIHQIKILTRLYWHGIVNHRRIIFLRGGNRFRCFEGFDIDLLVVFFLLFVLVSGLGVGVVDAFLEVRTKARNFTVVDGATELKSFRFFTVKLGRIKLFLVNGNQIRDNREKLRKNDILVKTS
jgi:hypothetical protein